MVDGELDYSEKLEGLISNKEERVKKLRIIFKKEGENIEEERNLMDTLIKKEKADKNPLKIEELAVEVIKMGKKRYEMIYALKKHVKGEEHALDVLKEEIEMKKVLSTKSFSNEEKVTERKKEKKWLGGKNE